MRARTIAVPALIAAALVYSTFRIDQALVAQSERQNRETETVLKWNQHYTALGAFEKKWRATIPSARQTPDLASLIEQTKVAPLTWPDLQKMSVQTVRKKADAYVYETCLSDGQGGVEMKGANAAEVMTGLDQLSRRHDISFDGVKLHADKEGAYLRFTEFCVLLRGDGDA